MKILSIGNSFSQDAHKWLHKLAKLNQADVQTANLYIGGCSLETHWKNKLSDDDCYEYEINGNVAECKISINEALRADDWDVVTVQQVSQHSGQIETYEPYLSNLVSAIKSILPKAKIYFHQTWAYEIDSTHGCFSNYNKNQRQMYEAIISTTEKAANSINAEIIPVGKVIQYLRDNTKTFDYKNGGLSLCRDGFHLSLDYGRFAAAATWLRTLIGKDITIDRFEDFDLKILKEIISIVNKI